MTARRPNLRTQGATPDRPSGPAEEMMHHSHKDVVNRLKRANGHIKNIIEMIESGRGCLQIAQQMHAVTKAMESAKAVLIHDHIDHCVEQVTGPLPRHSRGPLDEFKEITRYL